jgi:hypothetical protein
MLNRLCDSDELKGIVETLKVVNTAGWVFASKAQDLNLKAWLKPISKGEIEWHQQQRMIVLQQHFYQDGY